MPMPSMPLPSRDIRAVYAARRVVHGRFLTVHVRPAAGERPVARTAVVAGRRVGTAVDRNRAKRRLRALLQTHGAPDGVDAVLVAKPLAGNVSFSLLCGDYQRLKERLVDVLGRSR